MLRRSSFDRQRASHILFDGTITGFLSALPIALYHYYPQLSIILVTLIIVIASTFYLVIVLLTPVTKREFAERTDVLVSRGEGAAEVGKAGR